MTDIRSPHRWAADLTRVLNASLGHDRFPVAIEDCAVEISAQMYPDDRISAVKGSSLPGFEGMLFRPPTGKPRWGIIYNDDMSSPGRIRFTIAHEFGHYLMHRNAHPEGFQCGVDQMLNWDSGYLALEREANEFAADFLMPLDDFRTHMPASEAPNLDRLATAAERYGTSRIATLLRWLQYTERKTVLVVSRDGYVLWARSSQSAMISRRWISTKGAAKPVPSASPVIATPLMGGTTFTREHAAGVWFDEPVIETTVIADRYDFALSLLSMEPSLRELDVEEPLLDELDFGTH